MRSASTSASSFSGRGYTPGPGEGSTSVYAESERPLSAERLSKGLADEISLDARYPKESTTDLRRMSLFYEIEKKSRASLVTRIVDAVSTGKNASPVLRALAALPFPLVVTTNYDRLFERALFSAGK